MEFNDDAVLPSSPDDGRKRAELKNADMFGSGGGMSADTMKSVTDSAQGLISAAKSGGFKMTPNGVKPMRDAIADMMERLEKRIDRSDMLTRPPRIGAGPYQSSVSPHYASGGQTAQQALVDLRQVLLDCDEALARAADIYKETDAASGDSFGAGGSYEGGGSFEPSGDTYSGGGSFKAV